MEEGLSTEVWAGKLQGAGGKGWGEMEEIEANREFCH